MLPHRKRSRKSNGRARLYWVLWIGYGAVLFYLLFLKNIGRGFVLPYGEYLCRNCNLLPLRSVYRVLSAPCITSWYVNWLVYNWVGNLLLLVPWGMLGPRCFAALRRPKCFWQVTVCAVLAVELIQMFGMLGFFDIEDIFQNLLGARLGYEIWQYTAIRRQLG